jgi:photosystem II stability/assembly factor-like uncharacterized protein
MSSSIPIARIFALAALVLSAACTDRSPTGATGTTPPDGREVRSQIACTVSVADRAVRCGDPAPAGGGSKDIIMGGQGTYVRLESTNVGYDSVAAVFSLDVSVQNLLSLRMGTPDGTTATGVRVFFDQVPTAAEGSGEIEIANADGEGSYTRIGQPYYAYPEILEPRGASAPRPWRFNVPNSVKRFTFTVYVHTELPAEEGVLRWLQEEGSVSAAPLTAVRAMWGASTRDVFAVGLQGRILHFDGARWVNQPSGTSVHLLGVWGTSRSDVYAVGDSGTVLHYDGNRWTRLQGGVPERYLKAMWGRGDTLYIAGHQRNAAQKLLGLVMRSTDGGETWEDDLTEAPAGNRLLWGVQGGAAGHVYVSGTQANSQTGVPEAVILKTENGGDSWTEVVFADSTNQGLNRLWVDGEHVFAAGLARDAGLNRFVGLVIRSSDGGDTWTRQTFEETTSLIGVWGFSPTDVTVVGAAGAILHYDGDGWTDVRPSGTAATLQAVWGSSPSHLWAGGDEETFARGTDSGWTLVPGTERRARNYAAAWGSTADSLYVVAREYSDSTNYWGSSLMLRSGAEWTVVRPWENKLELGGIWGNDAGVVIVGGYRYNDDQGRYEGVILRGDGGVWSETPSVGGGDRRFNAVHGDGAGNVWMVGHTNGGGTAAQEALVMQSFNDGLSWSETVIPMPGYSPQLFDVWASGPDNVHAVGRAYSSATARSYALHVWFDGSTWSFDVADEESGLNSVWGIGADTIVAAGFSGGFFAADRQGLILLSTDGGASFEATTIAPTTGTLREFGAVWGASLTSLYVGGTGGGILHYDGARWEETGAGAKTSIGALWGFSASDVYAVGASGAVLHGIR